MNDRAVVLGVGMVPFATPSRSEPYDVLAAGAARAALADAGLSYEHVQQAYVGYVYGDSTAGQHVLYGLPNQTGMTGVPVVNVNNNCSTGSTALFLGAAGGRVRRRGLRAGARLRADAAAAPSRRSGRTGRARSRGSTRCSTASWRPDADVPLAPRYFGGAGARVRGALRRSRRTPSRGSPSRPAGTPRSNPYAVFRDPVTLEEVLASPHRVRPADPAAVLPADLRRRRGGAGAASASRARTALTGGVRITAQAMTTDTAVVVRGRHDRAGRLRHVEGGGRAGVRRRRASRRRTSRSSSCTTASPPTSC